MKKLLLLLFLLPLVLLSQSITTKREFRGAWVATVVNLDWPSSRNLSVKAQKEELIQLLDKLAEVNVNVVIFQIRTECDAFYQSSIEPWSYWLNGKQGRAPEPFYDPLRFAIKEAHKRGMELHAWFNPYRAVREIGNYNLDNNHVTIKHPDWILTFNKINIKILNPGLPQVREYVKNIVMDVVTRYDIDGVHFDDYFYPYPNSDKGFNGITDEDASTFSAYPRGFSNIDDWRRDNVNELIRMVYNSIQTVKPYVKFGVSPFGIWKSGVPSGIYGLDAYSEIYCDPVTWLNEQVVDYITPQLYWPFGGGQDYGKLLPWWATKRNNRFLIPGQALYRVKNWSSTELPNQIKLNRNTTGCYGSVFFRARNFYSNAKGITDTLKNNYYQYKALPPRMDWKDMLSPNTPSNLRYEALKNKRGDALVWDKPDNTSDGDSASNYAVYQFPTTNIQLSDLENPENILDVGNQNYKILSSENIENGEMYFTVTALDHNNNESLNSNILFVQMSQPETPLVISPADNAVNQRDTVLLVWNNSAHSNYNKLQLSTEENFSNLVLEENNIVDTFKVLTKLKGQQKYYWRVSAINQIGESDYSNVRSFSTGFPMVVNLTSPANQTLDVPVPTEFKWNHSQTGTKYHFQLAKGTSVEPSNTVVDTVIADTTITISNLYNQKIYAWKVRAGNQYGFSNWSETYKFRTESFVSVEVSKGIPTKFELKQNYPNPFNPVTTIQFAIPQNFTGHKTTLRIYDILGREVVELVNDYLLPGFYSVKFNGSDLSSGVYFYILNTGNRILSNKMILSK